MDPIECTVCTADQLRFSAQISRGEAEVLRASSSDALRMTALRKPAAINDLAGAGERQACPNIHYSEDFAHDIESIARAAPPVATVKWIFGGGAHDGAAICRSKLSPEQAHTPRVGLAGDQNNGPIVLPLERLANHAHFVGRVHDGCLEHTDGSGGNALVNQYAGILPLRTAIARALPTGSSSTSQRPTPKNATRASTNKTHARAARTNLRRFRGTTAGEFGKAAMEPRACYPGAMRWSIRGATGKLTVCICEEDACERWSPEEQGFWDRICATA